MLPLAFTTALEKIVGKEGVSLAPDRLRAVASDETQGLAPSLPDIVAYPKTASQVQQIVQQCIQFGVPITPRGAGSGKSGGAVPICGGLSLCFDRMNRIVDIDVANCTATVEPGVVLADLQDAVEAKHLYYPPDPASRKICTLGGNIAENASGPSTLKYGSTRDYVLGLELVLPTGEHCFAGRKTVKGVTGYDLLSLLVGSEGTLAIVTQIVLRLIPLPRFKQTALLTFSDTVEAATCVSRLLQDHILPKCIEYVDAGSIQAYQAVSPQNRQWQGVGAVLLIEVDGFTEESCLAQLEQISQVALGEGAQTIQVAHDAKKQRELWEFRHELSVAVKRFKPKKVSEDIVVPRSCLPELVCYVEQLGKEHQLFTCAFGHAGDGNLHVQVLFDTDAEMVRVEQLLEALFSKTIQLGGTLSGEHGIGLAKKRFLRLEQSDDVIALQRRIKYAFDPRDLLNPQKIFPTDGNKHETHTA